MISAVNGSRNHIRWTEDEWFELSTALVEVRSRRPFETLVQLAARAQEQLVAEGKWSESRVRNLTSMQMLEPAKKHIRDLEKDRAIAWRNAGKYREFLKAQQSLPKKEDLADGMTDEEVMTFFAQRVFANSTPHDLAEVFDLSDLLHEVPLPKLCGHAVERLVTLVTERELKVRHVLSQPLAEVTRANNQTAKRSLPHVYLVGMKPDQFERLKLDLEGLVQPHFVDKSRVSIQSIGQLADWVVIWTNFVSQAQRRIVRDSARSQGMLMDRVVGCSGGYGAVIECIRDKIGM